MSSAESAAALAPLALAALGMYNDNKKEKTARDDAAAQAQAARFSAHTQAVDRGRRALQDQESELAAKKAAGMAALKAALAAKAADGAAALKAARAATPPVAAPTPAPTPQPTPSPEPEKSNKTLK